MALTTVEAEALALARAGQTPPPGTAEADWVRFGLVTLLASMRQLRLARIDVLDAGRKADGSPVTAAEREVEDGITAALGRFLPEAVVVGEERGGIVPAAGWAVVVDPVDGTWGFATKTETWAITLAAIRDGEPVLGMVASPVTGEIGYAWHTGAARMLQISAVGEGDRAAAIPGPADPGAPLLVNLHPSRAAQSAMRALYESWVDGHIRMVRSPGGSPSWALLEAARGHYTYVNLWSKRRAEPWDLAAGTLIVRRAGGDVIDLSGSPIDPLTHHGPFVAAVSATARDRVVAMLRPVVGGD